MKATISAGHGPHDKNGYGAVGYLNESKENRKIVAAAIKYMKGHTVYDCTDNSNHTATENLRCEVAKSNRYDVDIHASVHLNAYKGKEKSDGKNKGVEVLITGNYSNAEKMAKQICKNIAALGFTNRGVKIRKDLYFLNATKGAALLVECCFVDDEDDAKLYNKVGSEAFGKAIAYGLQCKTVPKSTTTETSVGSEKLYRVQVGAYKTKKNAQEMQKKLKAAGFPAIIKEG